MRLRGFDEYEITLGDEMRGYRATLGKSFSEVESDLRIRAKVIRAIEDCDLDGFPNASVVPGYVRSYARYLGMDPEACYTKFCATSGYRSPAAAFDGAVKGGKTGAAAGTGVAGPADTSLTESRFALPPAPARLGSGINLGGVTSALALAALIGGLGYGGYTLLQDLQRVGFAPLPEAPEVVAEAPVIGLPQADSPPLQRPGVEVYQGDGVLAAFAPADLAPPPLPARDGPISAIDPNTSGIFAAAPEPQPVLASARQVHEYGTIVAAAETVTLPPIDPAAQTAADMAAKVTQVADAGPPHVVVHATETAWIRIRDAGDAVLFEGILNAGQRYEVPARSVRPMLRAGNAGAVYVLVNEAAYGPLGNAGGVVKNLSLDAADIAKSFPQASPGLVPAPEADATMQRAEATLTQ